MDQVHADRIAALLMEVANGEVTQAYALAEIDRIIMAERIDAAGSAHKLTRKLYRIPAGV